MTTPDPPSIEVQLAIINTKLDVLIEQRLDHEGRLRRLEQFKWVKIGAAAAVGGVAGRLASLIG
jgi:hypothetical protein